ADDPDEVIAPFGQLAAQLHALRVCPMVVEPIIGERQRLSLVVAAPSELEVEQPSMQDIQVNTARFDHLLQRCCLDVPIASSGTGAQLAQKLRVAAGNSREVGSAGFG